MQAVDRVVSGVQHILELKVYLSRQASAENLPAFGAAALGNAKRGRLAPKAEGGRQGRAGDGKCNKGWMDPLEVNGLNKKNLHGLSTRPPKVGDLR